MIRDREIHFSTSTGACKQAAGGWEAQLVSLSWIEALVAVNRSIIACERRFHDQCALIVERAAKGLDTAQDELLLVSYMTSLTLIRTHRDSLLAEVSADV